jgi:hypothetical protein
MRAAGDWSGTLSERPAAAANGDKDSGDGKKPGAKKADEPNPADRWHTAMRFNIEPMVVDGGSFTSTIGSDGCPLWTPVRSHCIAVWDETNEVSA